MTPRPRPAFRRVKALLLAAALALPVPAPAAEGPATLVADRVELQRDDLLVATGAVEVLYQGSRLRAARVSYDGTAGTLAIEGPIVLTEAGGGTIVLADAGELSSDLREGLLQSARMVLDRQLQIAAAELRRVGGRYTQASRVVASSCRVCAGSETPLWEIRARRVIHDAEERQIYFQNAEFRIAGLPVAWLPRLRMPDPTLERATGFLMPVMRSTSGLGFGIGTPYFIRLGDTRDVTLYPFLSTKGARAFGLRYRQAFANGEIELTGTTAHDGLVPGQRGHATAAGRFDLGRGYVLRFDAETVSDRGYLADYGLSDTDRLESRVSVGRIRRDEYVMARLVHFHSIREGEANNSLPAVVGDVDLRRRFALPRGMGVLGLRLQGGGYSASQQVAGAGLRRLTIEADWRRDWLLPGGLLAAAELRASADYYRYGLGSGALGRSARVETPAAMAELRWPWARGRADGGVEVIEPVAQLVWSRSHIQGTVPNEDSRLLEFDEGNLFAFNRFPGAERREQGTRLNLGLGYSRLTGEGLSFGGLVGRVLRADDRGQFTRASGLGGARSDWLVSMFVSTPGGLAVQGRVAFDDQVELSRSELRLRLERSRYGLATAWVWAAADAAEDRLRETSEWVVDGRWQMSSTWAARVSGRYDLAADRATEAGLGLEFANECLRVDLSLSRRFTSSTSVRASTDFGLSVDLVGFGAGSAAGPAGRACRG